jgi:hypothetical protein
MDELKFALAWLVWLIALVLTLPPAFYFFIRYVHWWWG